MLDYPRRLLFLAFDGIIYPVENIMPMKSKAQRAYLWAKHPEVAREFENETAKGAKLPKHVKKRLFTKKK